MTFGFDYIAALVGRHLRLQVTGALVAMTVLGASTEALAAGEFKVKGVVLPNGAVRVGDDRYRLPDNLESTLKWYGQIYRAEKFPRKLIVNQPGIKAYHVANPDEKDDWAGFNVYEYQGETRIFVLAREK